MTVDIRNPQGQPLTVADRSRVISESLRQMARVSRFADAKSVARAPIAIGRRRDYVTPALVLCLFVLPVLAGIGYFGLIASDRFITETRFAIRPAVGGAERAAPDAIGSTLGIPQAMILQDTVITMEYIHSRPMIEALERQGIPLRAMFSRASIDYPSRFNPERSIEKFVRYWQDRVEVSADAASGIVTMTVSAFTPEESLSLTRAILAEAERMTNELTVRARNSALDETRRELARSEETMARVRLALRDLRNKDGVLDAQRTAEANLKMLSELRGQRIQLQVRQGTLARDLAPEARSMQELQSQIRQIDDTIAGIERAATSTTPQERRVLSETMTSFENLESERRNAEKYHAQVIAAHERAQIIAARQLEFFSLVVEPVLPASSQSPRRVLAIVSVIAAAAALLFAGLFVRRVVA